MKKQEYTDNKASNEFYEDVLNGLKRSQKKLFAKYFYDSEGDILFQQIMNLPEYYLTNCELDIFKNKTDELAQSILEDKTPFDLIELGAGDATKSTFLLKYLSEHGIQFSYMPIDISNHIISELNDKLNNVLPDLEVIPLAGEYFEMLDQAKQKSERRKVVLFLGSNIGNMEVEEAYGFCLEIRKKLRAGDIVIIGFDLKKDPHTIISAYDDAQGITAAFNLNLLKRINRELDTDFDIDKFQHYQTYDPVSGACRSYLISKEPQSVRIKDEIINFEKDEPIDMEISQKFSETDIQNMARDSGFHVVNELYDAKKWFIDAVWKIQ